MDPALSMDDFAERFQFEIAANRAAIRVREFGEIFLRGGETVCDKGAHADAGTRKTRAPLGSGLLHVFTERELDAGGRAGKFQLIRRRAIAQLDDAVLSADGIGGTMQKVRA